MGINIKPEVIVEKVEGYIKELEGLKKVYYSEGQAKMYTIDANVKSFLTVAFDNSKERNRDYQGIAIGIGGLSPEKEQEFYMMDLDGRIRTLKSWIEEMKLIIETGSSSLKVEKIKNEIEEKELESTRREKVAETKFYGAVIELLDLQRNMLKDKEENTKHLITLQKDVQDLKENMKIILKELLGK